MQQDYLLRMIQQLGGFISGVMQLRRGGKSEEAILQIQDAIGRFSGLSGTLVHAISEDDLIELLRARGGIDPDRAWALAELLREEALAFDELDQHDEAAPRYLKSLRLYLEVFDVMEDMPDILKVDGLEEVIEKISGYDLSRPTRLRLIAYFVDTQRFDRGENVVLWSVESAPTSRMTIKDAIDFYEALIRLPERDLELGGLPIEEVRHGLQSMLDLMNNLDPAAIEG